MKTVKRTVQLPIEYPGDDVWKELRAVAAEAARFGNLVLGGQYLAKSGFVADVLAELGIEVDGKEINRASENVLYKQANGSLSGWVRNAMKQGRCRAYWQRNGKLVLRGSERLACYSADRALSIQADQRSNQGALYEWDGESPVLVCRFRPARTHEPIRLTVALNSTRARKDAYITDAIGAIWSGDWIPGTIHFRFDRRRRKLSALIAYSYEVPEPAGGPEAVLGPLTEDRQIWLRVGDDGPAIDFSDRLRVIDQRKEHHAGIVDRLRRKAGRRGRSGRYHKHRRKLDAVQSFGDWSYAHIHEWSAHIVAWCVDRDVGVLIVDGIDDGEWPAHDLRQKLKYKCEDAGIEYRESAEDEPAWLRARQREVRKQAQILKRAKEGHKAVRRLVSSAER